MIRLYWLILLNSIGVVSLTAQLPPVIKWQKTISGSEREWISSVIPSPLDDSYFLVGRSHSKDGDFDFMEGEERMYILRLSSEGEILWKRAIDYKNKDALELTAGGFVTNDNKLLISIWMRRDNGNLADYDEWIMKMDLEGTVEWEIVVGGSFDDSVGKAYETEEGNFIFVGSTWSNDGDIPYNAGLSDAWIIELSKNGELLSSRTYGGRADEAFGIIYPVEDGYLITGRINHNLTGRYDIPPGNPIDFMLTKVDKNLDLVWQKYYGGALDEFTRSIYKKKNGNFLIAADSYSEEMGIIPTRGGGIWFFELDEQGDLVWEHIITENINNDEVGRFLEHHGALYLYGHTGSDKGIVKKNYGEDDIFLAQMNTDGSIKWSKNFGGSKGEWPREIVFLDNGDYLLFGSTRSHDVDIDENKGDYDIWIAYLETPVYDAIEGQCQFSITKNENQLSLLFKQSFLEPIEITIYDALGRTIYYDDFSRMRQLHMNIDLPNPLPMGQYFVSIQCADGQTTVPFFYTPQ